MEKKNELLFFTKKNSVEIEITEKRIVQIV